MHKRLLLTILAFSCLSAAPVYGGIVGSGCSISNYGYLTDLAREYERRTGLTVVVRGGGTVLGIEDLKNGTVDFAASCRDKDKNDPPDIDFIQVAWDALVFIVNKMNIVDNVSLNDVREIYEGKITNWKQLGGDDAPIKVFISKSRKGLSGVEASLRAMVLQGKEPAESPNCMSLSSTGIVEQTVEKTRESFATAGYSSSHKRNIKMLKVNGVSPSYANIVNKTYGLSRPLYIIIPKKPKPEVKRFLDFILSKEGQEFIRSHRIVSLEHMK